MGYSADKRTFLVTDGQVVLDTFRHYDTLLPDPRNVGIVAIQAVGDGFEWTTAKATCPHCGIRSSVLPSAESSQRKATFTLLSPEGHTAQVSCVPLVSQLLNDESLPLLGMVGNLGIAPELDCYCTCPICGADFPVCLPARARKLSVIPDEEKVVLRFEPTGPSVTLQHDSVAYAGRSPVGEDMRSQLTDFMRLPHTIGVSVPCLRYITWALGLSVWSSRMPGALDIADIALHARFRDYPAAFYEEAKTLLSCTDLHPQLRSRLFELPRRIASSDMLPALLKKASLPDKPSVRRAAAARPALLAMMVGSDIGSLCHNDPNIAVSLFDRDAFGTQELNKLLGEKGSLCDLFIIAAGEETPSDLLRSLKRLSAAECENCRKAYDDFELSIPEAIAAYRQARTHHRLSELLKQPSLLERYSERGCGVRIRYTPEQRAMQGTYQGYRIYLPRTTGRFETAGLQLHDCLNEEDYGAWVALGRALVFLVARGRKLFAAVELDPATREVKQALGKVNRSIERTEELGCALVQWAKEHDVVGLDAHLVDAAS